MTNEKPEGQESGEVVEANAQQGSNDKKSKVSIKYPPYVNAYGSIPKLFSEITKASVPPKFSQDFMHTALGLKSSSHRALIPLLKKLGFLDAANVPTEAYKHYRDAAHGPRIMAEQLRTAYEDLYKAHEYAHDLQKEELTSKLRTLTGAAEDDPTITAVVGTFLELKKLADFASTFGADAITRERPKDAAAAEREGRHMGSISAPIGLSYTINLNLPATTEIEVFNAIFKSLREHLLDG